MGPIDNSAIADTVAAIFRSREFAEHNTVSIGQLLGQWVWSLFIRFLGFAATHPAVGFVIRVALALVGLLILGRIGYSLLIRYSASPLGIRHSDAARGTDWFRTAQERAAQGDYTSAAHALYLALLGSAASRGLVSLHESKTTGDYLRELRRRSDAIDIPKFSDFTRSYETVIYGIGTCDHDRYSRLFTIASTLLGIPANDRIAARSMARP
jgi:hypothetical protein